MEDNSHILETRPLSSNVDFVHVLAYYPLLFQEVYQELKMCLKNYKTCANQIMIASRSKISLIMILKAIVTEFENELNLGANICHSQKKIVIKCDNLMIQIY